MTTERVDVIITANSPGEVATWLVPVVEAVRRRLPEAQITVFIPPCTFASGRERYVIDSLPGVDVSYDRRHLLRLLLWGKRPVGFKPGPRGVVLFLGGDLTFAALLAQRLGYPAFAYTEGRVNWTGRFVRFFLPDQQARVRAQEAGAPADKLLVVGDLMLDAVRPQWEPAIWRETLELDEDKDTIALFPGSRPRAFRYMLPFLLRSAEIISRAPGAVQFIISISPFVQEEQIREALARGGEIPVGTGGELSAGIPLKNPTGPGNDGNQPGDSPGITGRLWHWRTQRGLTGVAVQGWQYDVMRNATLAVTIPGSNTAEMAALGLPMVVVLPLNWPELIPLEGLPGLIGAVPFVGPKLKRKVVLAYAHRVRFAALPNRRARQELVPELKGVLEPEDIAVTVGNLMRSRQKLQKISERLRTVMGEGGTADKIAATLAAYLEGDGSSDL